VSSRALAHRGSRLLMPLLFAGALTLLYYFADNNARWIERMGLDRRTTLRMLLFVAWVPAIFFLVRLIDLISFDIFARKRSHVRAPALLRELVSIGVAIVLFAIAYANVFEKSITAWLATGTVLAAILGFALQDTLGNLFAGIALHLEDSFEIGDVVHAGEFIGVVEAVRWRGTRLRTFNNNIVIVPNSVMARERVEVYPRNNFNARLLQIGVDYNVPPAKVIGVLVQAAANVEGVSREVPVIARVAAIGDASVTYDIKYFTTDYSQRDRIDAEIRKAAWYALRRNGISIPLPIRALHRYQPAMHRHQPEPEEIAARLAGIDILSPLSAEGHHEIAALARVQTWSRGETNIRYGEEGNSMFIVHEGTVSVRVPDDSDRGWREVAELRAGDVFGEMALLTGETRTADVVALSDVVTVEIAKGALQPVLQNNPDLAASISSKIAERRDAATAAPAASHEEAQHSVLSRIRSYFGL
jgi:small-conductance mechanosensitive channel/CRP-like cAMP-binding protein